MKEKENLPRKVTDQKKKEIVTLLGGEPRVLYLFSGGIARAKDGSLRATNIVDEDFADKDEFGYLGGVYRMLATVELSRIFPQAQIVTTSYDPESGISHAKVYREQLVQHGVDPGRISLEENSVGTRGELKEMVNFVLKNKLPSPVAIIANDYHIERIQEMWVRLERLIAPEDPGFKNRLEEFAASETQLLFTPAEMVLEIVDSQYAAYFKQLSEPEKNLKFKKNKFRNFHRKVRKLIELRYKKEAEGVADLKSDKYRIRS